MVDLINYVVTVVGDDYEYYNYEYYNLDYEYYNLAQNIANYERKLAQVSDSVAVIYCDIITTEGITNWYRITECCCTLQSNDSTRTTKSIQHGR